MKSWSLTGISHPVKGVIAYPRIVGRRRRRLLNDGVSSNGECVLDGTNALSGERVLDGANPLSGERILDGTNAVSQVLEPGFVVVLAYVSAFEATIALTLTLLEQHLFIPQIAGGNAGTTVVDP